LSAIDQPGVVVIVNPGWTSEQLSMSLVKQGRISLNPDNRTIFELLVAVRSPRMTAPRFGRRYDALLVTTLKRCHACPARSAPRAAGRQTQW
jgi:hypothetical protein